jgi:hypothetical protein
LLACLHNAVAVTACRCHHQTFGASWRKHSRPMSARDALHNSCQRPSCSMCWPPCAAVLQKRLGSCSLVSRSMCQTAAVTVATTNPLKLYALIRQETADAVSHGA